MKNIKIKLAYLLTLFIYGTIGVILNYIDVPSELVVLFRGALGALTIYTVLRLKKGKLNIAAIKKNLLYLIISGASLGFNWVFLFMAYDQTSVAIASLCNYMAPIILVALSPILFKEKLTFPKVLCVIACFVGVAMISGVFELQKGSVNVLGIIFGLLAATGFVFLIIFNKKLTSDLPNLDRSIIQLLVSAIVVLPFAIFKCAKTTFTFDLKTILILIMLGVIHTGFAYILYFKSVKELPVQTVSIFGYFEPIIGIILAAIILGQNLTIFGIIGTILIIGGSIVSELI